ncbi:MAG: hypothetical protein JNL08_21575 [Planctomycetes bacterium]|nr:hypothetical protein [Planctomycetota bacterium]
MRSDRAMLVAAAAVVVVAAASLRAQQQPADLLQPPDGSYVIEAFESASREVADHRELTIAGGFRFRAPGLQLELHGQDAVLLFDREEARALLQRDPASDLPRRGIEPPAPRRRLSPDELRHRVDRTLRAVGQFDGLPGDRTTVQRLDLLRFLYCEGSVSVVRDGLEVLRCDRLWLSPLDDRVVVENAELRYRTQDKGDRSVLVVRGPRLVKQGGRWTGRDVTVTTCTAGHAHAALAVGEVEILERDGEFEVVARDQRLQIGGVTVMPLPDARFFTRSQSEFPIRRASAGYSEREGAEAEVVLGLPWNRTGGALHEWLTGRPAHEFRGDWELGIGWIEQRGVPLEAGLGYGAHQRYEGRTRGFWLDDRGTDLREIQSNFDGSPIDAESRGLVASENRLHLGPSSHLDLVAFHATDPGVYSEFFRGQYRTDEVPETSAYLHHADGNRLLTLGGRWNLDSFSYRDDRALAESFTEELPVATWQWLAQPIGTTPWHTPIVLDLETDLGQRRSDFDDLAPVRTADRTFRADQTIELSAPFHLAELNVRPFFAGRGTWYDATVDGDSEGRIAVEGGVQIGTRLSRTWSWLDDDGSQAVRHVIAPKVTWRNRFHVDDDASQFFQFDATDRLGEAELVRVELRNLLQRSSQDGDKAPVTHDFVMLDLAQDFWPDAARDNGGDTLGLLYYDLLVRPMVRWLPFETFAFAVYGDYDWRLGMRTFDTELQVGRLAGIVWTADYREDRTVEGAVGISGSAVLLDRWNVFAGSQRDLQRDEWLSYTFGLVRDDHDWSISASAVYNPFTDQTTFRLEFLPRFGGMNRGRADRFGGDVLQASSNFATAY